MRRSVALLAASLLACVAFGQPAYARTPQPVDVRFVALNCGFPVAIHQVGKYSVKIFERDNGRFAYKQIETSPGLKVTFKNLATGKTLRYSIAGPRLVKIQRSGASSIAEVGAWGWPFHPVTHKEGLWTSHGRIYTVFDKDGDLVSTRFTGHVVNVCRALA